MQNVMERMKTVNRWAFVALGVAVIAVVAIFGGRLLSSQQTTQASKSATVKAFTGDLSGSITGSGHLKPVQDASLSMATTGIVKAVKVQVGDLVKAGDVLVQLDDTDQQQALAKAQIAVQQAQVSLASAQYDYNSKAGWTPNQNQLNAAEATLANAQAAVQAAQADYDKVAWLPWVSSTQQSLNLQQATNNYNKAQADLNYVNTNRPDITPARNTLENAKLSVSAAQISLQSAQTALDKTTLKAPFDGTITAVNTAVGESAQGPIIEMVTMNALDVVLNIDEVDIGTVNINQPAVVTFDSFPGDRVTGKVTSLAPKSTPGTADVVTYEVHVSLDKTDLRLLAGMTANATIQTFNLKGVLLVPNSAMFPDRETGKYYVNVVTPQGVKKTEVTIGAHDNQYTQILSGIQDGDELQTNNLVPIQTLGGGSSSSGSRQGPFGGS